MKMSKAKNEDTNVKDAPKRILFNLERKWYDEIAKGAKCVEYREIKPHWTKRLHNALHIPNDLKKGEIIVSFENVEAVFRWKYDGGGLPDIVRRIIKVDVGPCPYGGEKWKGDFYRIYFAPSGSNIIGRESPCPQCYECANCGDADKDFAEHSGGSCFKCKANGKNCGTWHMDVPNECPCKGVDWMPREKK